MKLNQKAYQHAKDLIMKGKWKQTENWEPPTSEEENRYIEEHGWEEYGKWFLGVREDTDEETKQHYAYPFTDDFKNVNRKGLVATRQRAGQQGEDEIFEAAGKLLEMMDAQTEKHILAYREKNYPQEVKGVYGFVIASEDVDRVGDVLVISGMRYENYMKNPVVLWNHDSSSLPVGKVEAFEIVGSKVIAKVRFSETNETAVKIRNLIDEGILNAVSVGFMPIRSEPIVEKDTVKGYRYLEWELLEVSIVNIPANPYALLVKYLGDEIKKETTTPISSGVERLALGEEAVLRKLKEIGAKIHQGGKEKWKKY